MNIIEHVGDGPRISGIVRQLPGEAGTTMRATLIVRSWLELEGMKA